MKIDQQFGGHTNRLYSKETWLSKFVVDTAVKQVGVNENGFSLHCLDVQGYENCCEKYVDREKIGIFKAHELKENRVLVKVWTSIFLYIRRSESLDWKVIHGEYKNGELFWKI